MSQIQLETAARLLGPVTAEVVFLGGATIHLWITEPSAPPTRATDDVDVIFEVTTLVAYHRLGERLRDRGFTESAREPVICRWVNPDSDLVLDVMPVDPTVLGFSNPWYRDAIRSAASVKLGSGLTIMVARPVHLIATKLAAWNDRGGNDILRSLDVHDVFSLIDGRPGVLKELERAPAEIKTFLQTELRALRIHPYFEYALQSVTNSYGPAAPERALLLAGRIEALTEA